MRLGIMQPYFLPYIGYFQLIDAVDEFVVYDNIEFTKKGWINRNRILVNSKPTYITLPLKNDSDYLDVRDRHLAESWPSARKKILNRIEAAYRKAPAFDTVYPLIEECILFKNDNLFVFILNSLKQVTAYLGIDTPVLVASTLPIDHGLKAANKVIAICKSRCAKTYMNPIGGIDLYRKGTLADEDIEIQFLKSDDIKYRQFDNEFVPSLSILDVMMFKTVGEIQALLTLYALQ